MTIYYRGAGVGTYWHENDPRRKGFTPHSPGTMASRDRMMNHICKGTVQSPYVSLTRSYGVALAYAMLGKAKPTRIRPALIWEVELAEPIPGNVSLLDPVREVAQGLPPATAALSYQHDGPPSVLLGLIDAAMHEQLTQSIPAPPGGTFAKPPNVTLELQCLVFALRDAELLALGTIPAASVRDPYEVY